MSVARTRLQRGETFTVGLRVASGDPAGVNCRMVLKRAVNGLPPGDAAEDAGVFDVTFIEHLDASDPTSPAAFIGVLSAEASEALTPGLYVMDARLVLPSGVGQTERVQVTVEERVTEAP